MILQVMFEEMDKRILDYLKSKIEIKQQNPIKISHRQIATDLRTAREVVTRILKKLELENKISQELGLIKYGSCDYNHRFLIFRCINFV